MDTHVRILGILNIILGAMGLIGALAILLIFGGAAGLVGASADPDARIAIPIIGIVGGAIAVFLLLVSLPGIIAGIGLLQFREWARILTIVLSAINLLNVPFGTALGVYGLWVLMQEQTVALFRQARVQYGRA